MKTYTAKEVCKRFRADKEAQVYLNSWSKSWDWNKGDYNNYVSWAQVLVGNLVPAGIDYQVSRAYPEISFSSEKDCEMILNGMKKYWERNGRV